MLGTRIGAVLISTSLVTCFLGNAHAGQWAQIRAVYGNRCLDVADGRSDNMTPVQMYDCNGTAAQQWFTSLGQNPQPIWSAVWTGELLAKVLEGTFAVNAVVLDEYSGAANQQWSMPRIEILSNVLGNKCLTAYSTGTVEMTDCTWAANQFFTYDESTSTVRTLDGRCLGVGEGRSHDELPYAWVYSCYGSVNQQWTLQNGNFVVNWDGQEQRCLDLQDNTSLPLYPCNGNSAQKFYARGQIASQDDSLGGGTRCLALPIASNGEIYYWNLARPDRAVCSGEIRQQWEIRW